MVERPCTSWGGSSVAKSRSSSSRISARRALPRLHRRAAGVGRTNRSSRLAQPPNRPRARSATISRKQARASNRGCGSGTAWTTTSGRRTPRPRSRVAPAAPRVPLHHIELLVGELDRDREAAGAAPASPAPVRRACTPRTAPARGPNAGRRTPAPPEPGSRYRCRRTEQRDRHRGRRATATTRRTVRRPRSDLQRGEELGRSPGLGRRTGDAGGRSGNGPIPTGPRPPAAPSACRTASSTARSTPIRSRKRTSSLAGWTLTSTSRGSAR